MRFAIWLENQSTSEEIQALFLDMIQFFDIQKKWMPFVNQVANQKIQLRDISIQHAKDTFNLLASIIGKDMVKTPDGLWEIPQLLEDIYSKLQGYMPKELYEEIRNKLIAEKRERIDRIFDEINGIADMLDMPPITDVKAKFDRLAQMVNKHDFWQISLLLVHEVETAVRQIENGKDVIRNLISLKNHADFPRIFRPGNELDISDFFNKAIVTYKKFD